MHWVHMHLPPGKKSSARSEMSKRGEKVPPSYVIKKECARSAKKVRKKEDIILNVDLFIAGSIYQGSEHFKGKNNAC